MSAIMNGIKIFFSEGKLSGNEKFCNKTDVSLSHWLSQGLVGNQI